VLPQALYNGALGAIVVLTLAMTDYLRPGRIS
jgi:hypothetical protein